MSQPIMRFCRTCQEYTLNDACPRCGGKAVQNTPAKFSPEDHYGKYRRELKVMDRKAEGAKATADDGKGKAEGDEERARAGKPGHTGEVGTAKA